MAVDSALVFTHPSGSYSRCYGGDHEAHAHRCHRDAHSQRLRHSFRGRDSRQRPGWQPEAPERGRAYNLQGNGYGDPRRIVRVREGLGA